MGHSKTLFAMAILTVALSLMTFALSADSDADPPTTGQCGDDMHWTFYSDQSRLVIEGSGPMYDFSANEMKWGGNLGSSEKSVSVEIGEGVTSLGKYAFYDCASMTSIALPDSLTVISSNSFDACINLPSIYIPKGVGTIGSDAFAACSSLASIDVAEENLAFQSHEGVLYTEGLTELVQCPANKEGSYSMPDGVKVIRSYSFCDCKLQSITLPDSLETIEGNAFWFCENLTGLDIPKNVKSIGIRMVYSCPKFLAFTVDPDNRYYASENGVLFDKNMTRLLIYPQGKPGDSYDVPEKVQSIDEFALSECNNLTEVTLPKSLRALGGSAFYNCSNLSEVTINYGVSKIRDGTFQDCKKLSKVVIPDSVTEIENWSFLGCKNIAYITIPYSVSVLESNAFDVSFYDANGDKLDDDADGLHGNRFEKKNGKLVPVSPGVHTISFQAMGGEDLAPLTTSEDGKLSELPNTI